jgi:hypothetical protein
LERLSGLSVYEYGDEPEKFISRIVVAGYDLFSALFHRRKAMEKRLMHLTKNARLRSRRALFLLA